MTANDNLLENLCRCVAFHLHETELTFRAIEEPVPEYVEKIAEGRRLIAEAGFDIDVLYPPEQRTAAYDADGNELMA